MGRVPEGLRASLAAELIALVRGERPALLTWVEQYGPTGARLIEQPPEIWSHPRTNVVSRSDGGWHVVLPLWTEDESPSDLSAEVVVARDGHAELLDVHVL